MSLLTKTCTKLWLLLFVSPFHLIFTSDRFDVCTIVRCSNPRWHYYFWSFLLLFLQFSIQILKRPTYKTNVNKQSAELSNVFSRVARKVEFCSLQQTSAYSAGRAILKVISILKDIFSCTIINVELIEFRFLILWNISLWIWQEYHVRSNFPPAWHVLRRWCGWWFVSPVKNRWKNGTFKAEK